MARPQNRSQLMNRLGAVAQSTTWSSCAVNAAERKVYFGVWTDDGRPTNIGREYLLQSPDPGADERAADLRAARKDQDEKLELVFRDGYEAYAYFNVARDRLASPREIGKTRTSFVMRLALSRLPDGSVVGAPVERVEIS
jgi:hypothetical protein